MKMQNRISLLEEYRLIERSEHEINAAWKGAHILLFFLAFIFGCFCTFCFHMLMYMFDEKCVLFPKLQSLTSLRHNVIYEFVPAGTDAADMPVDFLSTQWVEKSVCYLPTFVPLVSGIFGLVWTTMFLMCSTGSRTLSGLQRPWRILPPIFVFSLAMGGICVYSSSMTHNGLEELCLKLSEITGSPTCSYTVNVATLVYERRIRGVYQATRLTIMSAWLHTSCWLLSAVLALVRVILIVDFQLVRVNVDLIGDTDKLQEQEETHVRTVSPDRWIFTSDISLTSLVSEANKHKSRNKYDRTREDKRDTDTTNTYMLYFDGKRKGNYSTSDLSLVPEERAKLARQQILESVAKEHHFIAKLVFDLVDNLSLPTSSSMSLSSESVQSLKMEVVRQYGQSRILSLSTLDTQKSDTAYFEKPHIWLDGISSDNTTKEDTIKSLSSTSQINLTDSMRRKITESIKRKSINADKEKSTKERKRSTLKHVSIQTDQKIKLNKEAVGQNVQISEPKYDSADSDSSSGTDRKKNKTSQARYKEKQD